ncbi:MAG: TIGR00730 family Rossman fold protein [Pseudomonadota bacterium]
MSPLAGSLTARTLKNVGVFCGANPGSSPAFMTAATALGRQLASEDVGLVYGGASKGLMGAVADAAIDHGGRVVGVIPEALGSREIAHQGLSALHVVGSMHERKALMAEHSDAFITLPGGFGTLDETFEVLTWTQIGVHHKPLGLLNVEGFFDGLIAFADSQVAAGFVQRKHRDMIIVEPDHDALLRKLEIVSLPSTRGWKNAPAQ